MKPKTYFPILFIVSISLLLSCSRGKSVSLDNVDSAAVADSVNTTKADGLTNLIPLNSDKEVKEFLAFKKFSNSAGWIAFNQNGGVMDNESFTLTDITIESPYKQKLAIEIPKMKLSGEYILEQNEDGVTLTDAKTGKVYK